MTASLFVRSGPFESYGSGAVVSPCGRYRYRLWRNWGRAERRVLFLMLNPSTADEHQDDPTIRKCVGFARRWGYGALDVVNLFAWRSTAPRGLLAAEDATGVDNDRAIAGAYRDASGVVLAWGSHGSPASLAQIVTARTVAVSALLRRLKWESPRVVECLGRASNGNPRHPLMLAYDTPLEEWRLISPEGTST